MTAENLLCLVVGACIGAFVMGMIRNGPAVPYDTETREDRSKIADSSEPEERNP